MQRLLLHHELDRILDDAARDPERFMASVDTFIDSLEREGADIEISDPRSWRRSTPPARTSFIQQFRADVDSIIPLDREEEARLARKIEFTRRRLERAQAGGEPPASPRLVRRAMELHALRSEMVERNLYLVLINVERFAQMHASRLDLIQEGCVSLFRAVDGFDWRRGLLFRTYAVHWLNQAFRNYLYNNGHTVRVPVYLQKALKGINQAKYQIGDVKASSKEIAEASELDENLVVSALTAARATYSLDIDLASSGERAKLRDLLVDEDSSDPYSPELEDVSLEHGLGRALSSLNQREQLVLRLRFGIGEEREHTLAEVAQELGVSVERVRQIQVRAISKLDTPALRRDLEPFVN